jgi:hypothetical protein
MRYSEFASVKVKLSEVNMAPGNLKKLATDINGICGIEFELLVPNGDEPNREDNNERCRSFDNIVDFFSDEHGINDDSTIDNLRDELETGYNDYLYDELMAIWDDVVEKEVRKYIIKNKWDKEAAYEKAFDELKFDDQTKAAANKWLVGIIDAPTPELQSKFDHVAQLVKDDLTDLTNDCIDYEDEDYQKAKEIWRENFHWRDQPDQQDYLASRGLAYMTDAEDQFSLGWPHLDGGVDLRDIAVAIETVTGRDSVSCDSYHDCQSYKGTSYVIEPDSSLKPEAGYSGVEIVSPALPVAEMIDEISKIMKWANNYGCYTNKSCGLHMNVSIEGVDMSQVDYVKLALFSGDQHVLSEFQRQSNQYCESAISQIQNIIQQSPDAAYDALLSLQQNLGTMAGKLIHSGETKKYTSINAQSNRVEFRSPGGDWLEEDIEKLKNMVYRFIVALDIACDPTKYAQEYATKLYKLINPHGSPDTTFNIFTQYQAGIIDLNSLKRSLTVKRAETDYPTVKLANKSKSYDKTWIVVAPTGQKMIQQSDTATGAINKMRSKLNLNAEQYPNDSFSVEPNPQSDIFNQFAK